MKKLTISLVILLAAVFLVNHLRLSTKDEVEIKGVALGTHYEYYLNPLVLVINIKAMGDSASQASVFGTLLRYADQVKDQQFNRVVLQYKGKDKFILQGDYFKEVGTGFAEQNPLYTMRTFPEHVYNLDGTPAYGTWSGGIFGVLDKQIEDFSDFNKKWYLNDMASIPN